MYKILSIAIAVVAVVLVMSGIVSVQYHPDKVAGVTSFVTSLIGNKDRLAKGQKALENLKNQSTQLFAKSASSTPTVSTTPTPAVAGAKDVKVNTKKPAIDVSAKIPLAF
jgi:hypothetical protein